MTGALAESVPPVGLPDAAKIAGLLDQAVARHRVGDLDAALAQYLEILAADPNHIAALTNLGILHASQGRSDDADTAYQRALALNPRDPDILTNIGNLKTEKGSVEEAERYYRSALELNPSLPAALANLSEVLSRQGKAEEALEFCRRAIEVEPTLMVARLRMASLLLANGHTGQSRDVLIAILSEDPGNGSAWCILGDLHQDAENHELAEEAYRRAIELMPDWGRPWQRLASLMVVLERFPEAITADVEALKIEPENAAAMRDLGHVMHLVGDPDKAVKTLEASLILDPSDWRTALHLGNVHYQGRRYEEARKYFETADQLVPGQFECRLNMGLCCQQIGRTDEAEEMLTALAAEFPDRPEVHNAVGLVYYSRGLYDQAITKFESALEIKPEDPEALVQLAVAVMESGDSEKALGMTEKVIALVPELGFAHRVRAQAFSNLSRHDEAIVEVQKAVRLVQTGDVGTLMTMAGICDRAGKREESLAAYRLLLRHDPDNAFAMTRSVDLKLTLCQWADYGEYIAELLASIEGVIQNREPLNLCVQDLQNLPISWPALAGAAKRSAETVEENVHEERKKVNFSFEERLTRWRSGDRRRLRVGWALPYTFFQSFPMLLMSVVERMDRQHFEVVGYSIRPGDTEFDRRYRGTFDSFRDIPLSSPAVAAQTIYDDQIDVLIDVTGHTSINCQPIMAMRSAPVQAHMLGYGITTGSDYIDYLVTDPVWMQPRYREHCTESMVYLPDSWFVGYHPTVADATFTRAEFGLPEEGFVYCSFNQPFKFEPTIFDIWMRMLKRVDGSVLWLGDWDEATRRNLKNEAEARGIDHGRVVFSDIVQHSAHLARLKLADLMVDTRFHGGGATTIDALWAGLPILTFGGDLPTSGNGTSMAHAIGVPEMAVDSLAAYEETGVELANDPKRYQTLREAVNRNRVTHPLFDRERYTRHLEHGILQMWEQTLAGKTGDLTVPPRPKSHRNG